MKKNIKIILILILLVILLLAWAPWMDNKAIHDKFLREQGWIDKTVISMQEAEELNKRGSLMLNKEILEKSRRLGITDGVVICDYSVRWIPFGRWVRSCEGGPYFVTFWGKI